MDVREPSGDEVLFRDNAKQVPDAMIVLQQKRSVFAFVFTLGWCGFLTVWYAIALGFLVSGTFPTLAVLFMMVFPIGHLAVAVKLIITLLKPNRYSIKVENGLLVATSRLYPKKPKFQQFAPTTQTQELALSNVDSFAMSDALIARRDGATVAEIFTSLPRHQGDAIAEALNNAYA